MLLHRYVFLLLLVLFIPFTSIAQKAHQLSHQLNAPNVDGLINELEWQQATVLSLDYDDVPGKGAPAAVKTIAYLYEDGHNLYVALRAFTSEPESIRAHLSDRDKARNDDLLGIVVDTFNDERNGYEFFVNPLGVQIDARMTDNRGWKTNDSWNTVWQSAAQITEEGWNAELSIPLSVLRFADIKGEKTWGIAVYRSYQGDSQRWLTNFKRDNEQNCNLCQFSKIKGFNTVKKKHDIKLIPGVTYTQEQQRMTGNDPWLNSDTFAASADISWSPNENSTINATINPNFSQVEADSAQLDVNSPHILSVQEKRSFFLDGAEYINTDLFNLVHTRNIIAPDYGLKYSGQIGDHSYGILTANDQETRFVLPGNQSSTVASLSSASSTSDVLIARYKNEIGAKSSLGVLFTQRNNDEYENSVLSLDGKSAITDSDILHFQWVQTKSNNPLAIQTDYDLQPIQKGNALSINYNRDQYRYSISAAYQNVDDGFRADLGFITESDYIRKQLNGAVKFYGQTNTWFKRGSTNMNYHHKSDQQGKLLEERGAFSANIEGKYHAAATLTIENKIRLLNDYFLDTQDYFKVNQLHFDAKVQPISSAKFGVLATIGDGIDYQNIQLGALQRLKTSAELFLGQRLNIKYSLEYRALHAGKTQHIIDGHQTLFGSGNIFTARQNDLRISYQFSRKAQLKLITQYTHVTRDTSLYRANSDANQDNDISAISRNMNNQLVFSYKFNAQSLFYLGYSDQGAENQLMGQLETNERRIFSKFSYVWQN